MLIAGLGLLATSLAAPVNYSSLFDLIDIATKNNMDQADLLELLTVNGVDSVRLVNQMDDILRKKHAGQ